MQASEPITRTLTLYGRIRLGAFGIYWDEKGEGSMLATRDCVHREGTLNTAVATTPEIDIAKYLTGEIYIPTGSAITSLTYHVAPVAGGTYLPAYDAAGSAVTQTVAAARAYAMPAAVFGAPVIKIVTNAAGAVTLTLKS